LGKIGIDTDIKVENTVLGEGNDCTWGRKQLYLGRFVYLKGRSKEIFVCCDIQ